MKLQQSGGIELQVRATPHGLQRLGVKTLELKVKIPGQKTGVAIDDATGDDKARLTSQPGPARRCGYWPN